MTAPTMPCGGDAFEPYEYWRPHSRPQMLAWTTRREGCSGCAKCAGNGGKCAGSEVLAVTIERQEVTE